MNVDCQCKATIESCCCSALACLFLPFSEFVFFECSIWCKDIESAWGPAGNNQSTGAVLSNIREPAWWKLHVMPYTRCFRIMLEIENFIQQHLKEKLCTISGKTTCDPK